MAKDSSLKGKMMLWIFVALYPILPSYTRIGGYAAYSWLVILTLVVFSIINLNQIIRVSKTYLIITIIVALLYAVPFLYHGELDRIIFEMIEVLLPMMLLFFSLKGCNQQDIDKIITILIAVSSILCIFGIIEFFFSFNEFSLIENMQYANPRFGSAAATRLGLTRIEQSFNTALTYALYLSMAFTLTFYRFIQSKKTVYLIIMVLQVVNVFMTLTRGVTLAFLAGFFGLIWFNRKNIGIKRILSIIIFVFFCFFISLACFPEILDSINEMLGSAINLLLGVGGQDIDQSSIMRQNFQSAAFEALNNLDVFLFGVGEYGLRSLVSIDNEWLLEITGYGIFGLIGFIILLGTPVVFAYKGLKKSNQNNNSNSKLFLTCMLVLLVEYYVSLYTVAQMAEARMYYIIYAIICFYSKNLCKGASC